jgi:hypothetical protein
MWEVLAHLDNKETVVITQDEDIGKLNPKIHGYLNEDGFVTQSKDGNVRAYYPARIIRKIEVRKVK